MKENEKMNVVAKFMDGIGGGTLNSLTSTYIYGYQL